jgi:hypothetical protein
MRGGKTDRPAAVVIRGRAFMQNLRRGHYELGVNAKNYRRRVAEASRQWRREPAIWDGPGRARNNLDARTVTG